MAQNMKPVTFIMTQQQLDWLEEQKKKTGLKKVEIVRRAVDDYRDVREEKEQHQFFTPQQRQNIKTMARMQNITEIQVIRQAINRETRVVSKRNKR